MTEKQLLKKLNIADFRYITKDKVMELASLYENVHPDVAMKALEQIPEFATVVRDALSSYKETVLESLKLDNEDSIRFFEHCDFILATLKSELDKPNLAAEDKKEILSQMSNILKEEAEYHKAIREHRFKHVKLVAQTAVLAIGAVVVALGGKGSISLPNVIGEVKDKFDL